MQVSIEQTSPLARRMTIGVEKERIQQEVQKRLQKLMRTVKINGFRPGKVPLRVVQQKYGRQVHLEVLDEVVTESLQEAFSQEQITPASRPNVDFVTDLTQLNLEEDFSYVAEFEVFPPLDAIHYEGLQVIKPVAEVKEADVEQMLAKLRDQRKEWHKVERPAAKHDQVIIDFVGTIHGEPFANNQFSGMPLVLGESEGDRFLAGLNEGLIGHSTGESVELDLQFPEDHKNPDLAGQPVNCQITIKAVEEAVLPELNEAFAQSLGVESGSIEELRNDVKENMLRELHYALKNKLKSRTLDALLAANPIELPNALIQQEAEKLAKSFTQQMRNYASASELGASLYTENFQMQAKRRVQMGLLLGELLKVNQIKPSAAKVREMIEMIASTYEQPEAVVSYYYSDPQRLKEIEAAVLEETIVEWLLERAETSEEVLDFETALQQQDEEETQDKTETESA